METPLNTGHEPQRDPQPTPTRIGEREDRSTDRRCTINGPRNGRQISGVDTDDSDVSVDVVSYDPTCCRVSIGERHLHLIGADIVRIGQHLTVTYHHAGSDTPTLPDADHRIANLPGSLLYLFRNLVENAHGDLWKVGSNLQVTTYSA